MKCAWPLAAATAIALNVILSCSPHPLSKGRWQRMRESEKDLYVRTLLGHEQVLTRKGGNGHRYSLPSLTYVKRIDGRFTAGERRTVEEIWPELADGRPMSPAGKKKTAHTEVSVPQRHPSAWSVAEVDPLPSHPCVGVHL